MHNMALLFCGIFFTLAFSFTGLILSSNNQFGALKQTTETLGEDGSRWKVNRSIHAKRVGWHFRASRSISRWVVSTAIASRSAVRTSARYRPLMGSARKVARDYIMQERVLLGTMRTGPDLANVGGRALTADWHHQHLYNPQITSKGSNMPPFAFLYEVREIDGEPSPNAVSISADSEYIPAMAEVIPTKRAEALVAYLLSLKIDYSLPSFDSRLMSDETKNDGKASLEKAAMQDADVQSVHAQLMREKDEPEEGFSGADRSDLYFLRTLLLGRCVPDRKRWSFRWDVYDPDFKEVRLKPSPSWRKSAPRCSVGSAQCHLPMVRACPSAFPPLVASKWVTGSERLARILINSLNGPVEVKGETYNGNMPAFGPNGLNLKPRQIAGVLTYIRAEWGNAAPEVTEEALKGYIDSYGERSSPWTAEELLADFPME